MGDRLQKIPSFDEVMQSGTSNGKIPSFEDIMGSDVKKKETGLPTLSASASASATASENLPTTTGNISTPQSPLDVEGIFDFGNKRKKTQPIQANNRIDLPAVVNGVAMGKIDGKELSDAYNNIFGKEVVEGIINRYAHDMGNDGWDKTSANSEEKWDELAKRIKTKNRINAKVGYDAYLSELDKEINNAFNNYRTSKTIVSGSTGGAAVNDNVIPLVGTNPDDPYDYSRVMEQLKNADKILDKDGKVVEGGKEKLISAINEKLMSITADSGVDKEIEAASPEITEAITRSNIDREFGENIPTDEFAKYDKENEEHFKLGLSFIKKVEPWRYKNVMRVVEAGKQVPDDDFRDISSIGQKVYNQQVFFKSADNPELIDKETNLDYTTRSDKKAQYAAIIGERLKAMGGKNMREYSEDLIKKVAADLPNKTIVDELAAEEQLLGYDAIPKSGAIEAVYQGIMQPIDGIRSTFELAGESPVETYIRSKNLDTGSAQKVVDDKGQASAVLPSDRDNIFYDAMRGLGQFIPQVLLTKGIGSPLANTIAADVRLAATPALKSAISTYGGTAISTFLQTYGDSYAKYLDKTGDPKTAKFGAGIDGVSAAGFELLLPDVKIADRAFSGLRQNLATDIIDLVKKGGNPADIAVKARPAIQKFVTNTINITGQEVAEEVGTNIVDYITESIFSPQTARDRELGKEIWETAKATAVSMSIPAILGGGGEAMNKDFTKNSFTAAAIDFDSYRQSLDKALNNNTINQAEYNDAIKLLSTHRRSVFTAPTSNVNGELIPGKQRMDYAYEETKIKVYKDKAEKSEGIAKEMWDNKIKQSEEIQRSILFPPAAPSSREIKTDEGELTPQQVVQNAANTDVITGMEGEMLKSGAITADDVLLSLAKQKYGVSDDGSVFPEGGRDISMKTSLDVDDAVTKAFPDQQSVIDKIKGTQQSPAAIRSTEGAAENVVPSTSDLVENVKKNKELTLTAKQWADIVRNNYKNVPHFDSDSKEVQDLKRIIEKDGYKTFDGENKVRGKINQKGEFSLTDGNHRMIALEAIDPDKKITIPIEYIDGDIVIETDGYRLKSPTTNLSEFLNARANEQQSSPTEGKVEIAESQAQQVPQQQDQKKPTVRVSADQMKSAQPIAKRIVPLNVEPPAKSGRTPVTLSGNTEDERQSLIKQRKSATFLPTQVVDEQNILDRVRKFNNRTLPAKRGVAGRSELNSIKVAVDSFNRTHNQKYTAVQNRAGNIEFRNTRKDVVKANNKARGDLSIDDNGIPLMQRSDKTKEVFNELLERNLFPTAYTVDGRRMTASQQEGAIQDILDGIPSRAANNYLDALEKMIEKDDFDFSQPDIQQNERISLNDILQTEVEQQGEMMTEQAIMDWLNEQSQLTPEQEETLSENLENIIYEYETDSNTGQIQSTSKADEGAGSIAAQQNTQPQNAPSQNATSTQANQSKPDVDLLTNELRGLLGNTPLALVGDANPKTRVSFKEIGITENDTIESAIDKLIAYGGEFTKIFEAVKADGNFKNIKLQLVDSTRGLENGESGLYYPVGYGEGMDGTLQLSNKDNSYYTAAHELMHFLTLDSAVANEIKNTPSYQALTDMYNYIASNKGKPIAIAGGATVENYGLTNEKEFMAELLINPAFRQYVSDVFAANKEEIFKSSKSIRDTNVSSIGDIIYNFFKDIFNKLFSQQNKNIDFDERKSVVDNAAQLATKLFFGGEDITSGQMAGTGGGALVGIGRGNLRNAALAFPSSETTEKINSFVRSAMQRGASESDIKAALVNNGISEADADSYINSNKPKSDRTPTDNEVISSVLNLNISEKDFPTIFLNNRTEKQITAITQGKGQDRVVDGDYVQALESDLREVSIQSAKKLQDELGANWGEKTLAWIESNPNQGNLAQVIGILNIISTDNYQDILDTHDGVKLNNLHSIQARIDRAVNTNARIASLGLRQRILYSKFATGGNMRDILLDSILTPEMERMKIDIEQSLSESVTDEEINASPTVKTTPTKKKSSIRNILGTAKKKSSSALRDELINKGAEVAGKTKKTVKELLEDAKNKIKNIKC